MNKNKFRYRSILVLLLLLISSFSIAVADNVEPNPVESKKNELQETENINDDPGDEEMENIDNNSTEVEIFSISTKGSSPLIGTFNGSGGQTIDLYLNDNLTSAHSYIEDTSRTVGIVPILGENNVAYKIAISGFVGWVDKRKVNTTTFSQAKSFNYYTNENGELFHHISFGAYQTNTSPIVQGKAPSYIKSGQRYLSFDGHYFYPANEAGLTTLINDYNEGHRRGSINPNDPFYNYFQYLPARAQTRLTANDFKNYLGISDPYISRLVDTEQIFIDYGNYYGGNPALAFAMGIHESDYGRSYFARARNNFFGHAAYDSNPGAANAYPSAQFGIQYNYSRFWNWNYIDGTEGNVYYYGGFVGNKNKGMNVKYASDPYWGEKIASHYYYMDKNAGFKDYGRYTIGLTSIPNINFRTEPNTNSTLSFTHDHKDVPFIITDEVKGSNVNGSTTWYKVTSEHLLNSRRTLQSWEKNYYVPYNFSNSQIYVHSSLLNVIYRGSDSKLLSQSKPNLEKFPSIESQSITVYTLADLNLRPDSSTRYTPILTIPKNTKLVGHKTDNGWFQVLYTGRNGKEYLGYVSQDFLSLQKGGKPITDSNSSGSDIRGDLNGDGKIDIRDMMVIRRHILSVEKLTGQKLKDADLNKDGKIDIRDMMVIRRHILNIELIK